MFDGKRDRSCEKCPVIMSPVHSPDSCTSLIVIFVKTTNGSAGWLSA